MQYRIWDKEDKVYTEDTSYHNLMFVLQDGTLSQFKNRSVVTIENKDNYVVERLVEWVNDRKVYENDLLKIKWRFFDKTHEKIVIARVERHGSIFFLEGYGGIDIHEVSGVYEIVGNLHTDKEMMDKFNNQ